MAQILDFQNVLSWASSGVIRSSCMSLRTPSTHLPLGLPLGLFPGTLMSPTALTSLFSSILCMCPYLRSLISLTFSCMLLTPSSFLMPTLFTLSLSVTPLILLNILISGSVNSPCNLVFYAANPLNITGKIFRKAGYVMDVIVIFMS